MTEWEGFGKILIVVGLATVGFGVVLVLGDKIPGVGTWFGWFGKLPGDLSIKREQFSFHFPIVTSLVLSVILSLLFYLLSWLFRR